jgi:hypothetical protein
VSGQLHVPAAIPPGDRVPGTLSIGGWVGSKVGPDDIEKRKFLILPGLEPQTFGRPAHIQSLYHFQMKFQMIRLDWDRFCSLVIRVPGYKSRGPGSIPGATRFSEYWVWNGVHSTSLSTTEELLERKSSGSGPESPLYPQTLALISPTSGGRSVCIVLSRTQAKEVLF